MRSPSLVTLLSLAMLAGSPARAGDKLTPEERIELMRNLTAEYATLKTMLPRSKKPLNVGSDGTFDKKQWEEMSKESGPAGRPGDLVQITKVGIESDKIVLEINGGLRSGRKWYDHVDVGMGGSGRSRPLGQSGTATLGSVLCINFPKGVPAIPAADFKKMLLPVMDFEKRSATEQYVTTLPPEVQKAVKEQRAIEGMDHDAVILALGRPTHKSRETKDGVDYEDWVYGTPPGKMTFVTFQGSKVIKVKETYAGLGGSTVKTPVVQ
jgi:hypothetical protein